MADRQDLVVIGGGAGGFAAAVRAIQLGAKVTVIESTHYGGSCMNKACIPLTFLMTAAQYARAPRKGPRFGIQLGDPQIDMETMHERKELLVDGLRMGTEQHLADYGVTLIEGRGKLVSRDTVQVDPLPGSGAEPQQIQTRMVILATGSAPTQLPLEGADLPGVIGTEEAIAMREIPPRLAIISNQAWDLELAQYFHALGSQVTLIYAGDQVLEQADRDTAQRLAKSLYDDGITIQRRTAVEAIRPGEGGALRVLMAGGKEIEADKVLAARRIPNSTGLGLREVGVQMEGASVLVDDRMQTNVPGIYAIGDLTPGPMWSHKANSEGLIAAENAMGLVRRMRYDTLPHCAYTWPQVAWVGLTQEQAEAKGIEIEIGKVPTALNPYAMILDETAGELKIITCKKYGKILGAHLVAPGAVDLINTIAVAMMSEATIDELMYFIPRHPSVGEALVDAAMDVEKRSIHMPKW